MSDDVGGPRTLRRTRSREGWRAASGGPRSWTQSGVGSGPWAVLSLGSTTGFQQGSAGIRLQFKALASFGRRSMAGGRQEWRGEDKS